MLHHFPNQEHHSFLLLQIEATPLPHLLGLPLSLVPVATAHFTPIAIWLR